MTTLRRICLLLSGCGAMDGSDVVETVLLASALAHRGVAVIATAPSGAQFHVLDHHSGLPQNGVRHGAVEAARFGIGPILPLAEAGLDADAVIIPGGAGTILTFCDLGRSGPPPTVNAEVGSWLVDLNQRQVPIGAMGLGALLVVAALSDDPPEVTVGNDPGLASVVTVMNGVHHDCAADAVWVDSRRRVATLPGRLLDADPISASRGIDRLIDALADIRRSADRGGS